MLRLRICSPVGNISSSTACSGGRSSWVSHTDIYGEDSAITNNRPAFRTSLTHPYHSWQRMKRPLLVTAHQSREEGFEWLQSINTNRFHGGSRANGETMCISRRNLANASPADSSHSPSRYAVHVQRQRF